MLRTRESQVLDFCLGQTKRFDARAWLAMPVAEREFWALVAFFMSGGQRFGHRDDLLAVAQSLRPNCAGDFAELVRRFDFDCSRFDAMLQDRITHERAVAEVHRPKNR